MWFLSMNQLNFDFLNFAENPIEGEYFFNEKIIEGYLNRKKYQHSKITKNLRV